VKVAGVMSGTSLDGIDVAIVELRGRSIRTLGFLAAPYPRGVREAILALDSPASISRWNVELAELYSRAILRAIKRWGPVDLVGCHGQTIYHDGGRHTLQIGEAAVIAERTSLPVVSNFRARDVAAGGEGAPLVPFVDYLLFRHPRRTRIALNIGGIGNVTVIPPGATPQQVTAFDTGPGNMVIDALVREMGLPFDRGGRIAASGRIDPRLLSDLLSDPYYKRRGPKSAGREQYGQDFVDRMKRSGLTVHDLVATATALTASSIALTVRAVGPADVIVSGGGAHNRTILNQLAALLPEMSIATSAEYGVDVDAKEAIAFAVLAYETWHSRPSNLPSATGASRAVVLGDLTPRSA
jgi:anhydro-N-acetylmuramic acid kinase